MTLPCNRTWLTILAALALSACSGTEGAASADAGPLPDAAQQGVAVVVAPQEALVAPNGEVGLTATVTGTSNTIVLWDVVEVGGGTVDATGLYRAPGTAGTFQVRASSVADPTKRAVAVVTVLPPVAVTVAPRTTTVLTGGNVTFTASVANATNGGVTWSVRPATGCGSVTAAGVYTAPVVAATCSVVATSVESGAATDTATVTVVRPVAVAVTPSAPTVDECRTLQFSATVSNATDTAVTWSVYEGAAGGTITAAGLYTAPPTAGTYRVVATSRADPTKSSVSTVTVRTNVLFIAVSPQTISVPAGGTAQFTATVTTTCGSVVTTQTVNSAGQVVQN